MIESTTNTIKLTLSEFLRFFNNSIKDIVNSEYKITLITPDNERVEINTENIETMKTYPKCSIISIELNNIKTNHIIQSVNPVNEEEAIIEQFNLYPLRNRKNKNEDVSETATEVEIFKCNTRSKISTFIIIIGITLLLFLIYKWNSTSSMNSYYNTLKNLNM